jgi:PHD/YefM family antitoxin component YafN of YafNO toxin-antitoxin module
MKECTISLSEASQILASLPEQFSEECPAIVITNENHPLMTVMPYKTHQSLLETIDSLQTLLRIMGSSDMAEKALQNKKEKASTPNTTHNLSWEEFQKEFGWE